MIGILEKQTARDNEERFDSRDGSLIVNVARESIKSFLTDGKNAISSSASNDRRFQQRLGCFVTLKDNNSEKGLRGCIGFPEPVYRLSKALSEAAVHAATKDPRFPPIKSSELDNLLLEVSLLTKPIQISVKDQKELPSKIRIGEDGLIMKWSFGSGLLLPQVASEYGWDSIEFLNNLSMKAGAPPDQWLVPGAMIYKFAAQVFQEISPNGNVILTQNWPPSSLNH